MDRDDWNARYDQSELIWSAAPNTFVREHTADLEPGRALDLACGEGRNAIWLAENGWDVVATDFSDVAISKAAALADHRGVSVDFRVEDAAALSSHETGYDLVVIAYLHLDPAILGTIVDRAAGQLTAGGTLVIVGHHVDNPTRGHGGPPDPAVLYDPAAIAERLGTLDVVTATDVERTVPTDTGDATAIDALVIARAR